MNVRRISGYWPFGLLCVVLSTRWTLADAWPGTVSTVSSQAVAAAVAAVGFFVGARLHNGPRSEGERSFVKPFLAGALLFAGLNAGLLAGSYSPRANDLLIALALTPAVIAVAQVSGSASGAGPNGLSVAPGIIAPAGLLLILAQPRFRSLGEDVALIGAPLCAGLGAVWLSRDSEEGPTWPRVAMGFAGAATIFALACLQEPRTPPLLATGLDLVVMVLTVWSLVRLGARCFSAQFGVVPLLLLLEGLLLTRVRPDWQQVGGLVLLLVSAALLLRKRSESATEETGTLFQ